LQGSLDPSQLEQVEAMLLAGRHLLSMVNAVLDLSQIEANNFELHPTEIDLLQLAGDCFDVIRPVATGKGLTLVFAASALPRLNVDPIRLRQVLVNLLGNAIKFTLNGTIELRVLTTNAGASVRIEVADTGPGIPAGDRDRVFHAFQRIDRDANRTIEGAGLGLSISAQLVHMMDGRIGYDDNPGGGSIFWLELPVLASVHSADTAAGLPSAKGAIRRLRVLVVDDDSMNRSIAKGFLQHAGHNVVCRNNGAAAVEAAASEEFDVILMDVRMPGMDGLEATRRIRALPFPNGGVPVLAVTAQAFTEQVELCRGAGMNDHISKPFEQAELLAMVERLGVAAEACSTSTTMRTDMQDDDARRLPVLDRSTYESTTECFSPEDVETHLGSLLVRSEALMDDLSALDAMAHTGDIADMTHRIIGGFGTYGFLRMVGAGRQFERAVRLGTANVAEYADELADAAEEAATVLRQELALVGRSTLPAPRSRRQAQLAEIELSVAEPAKQFQSCDRYPHGLERLEPEHRPGA
jgi:CheY-like chemotaxis protein